MEQLQLSDMAGGNGKRYSHFAKLFDSFLESSAYTYRVTQEFLSQVSLQRKTLHTCLFKKLLHGCLIAVFLIIAKN